MRVNNLSKSFVKIFTVFLCLIFAQSSYAATNSRNNNYGSTDISGNMLENMRGGIVYDWALFSDNLGIFVEYNFGIPFIGLRTGLEYGKDVFVVGPKGFVPFGNDDFYKHIDKKGLKQKAIDEAKAKGIPNDYDLGKAVKDYSPEFKNVLKDYISTEWGVYSVKFLSIPLTVRLYPFAGDLCLFFGIRFDYLLSARGSTMNNTNAKNSENFMKDGDIKLDSNGKVKDTDKTASKQNDAIKKRLEAMSEIDKDEKKLDGEPILNSTRWNLVAGLEHTFFFGVVIGIKYTQGLTSFVNYNPEKSEQFFAWNFQGTIGLDIIKIVNLF